MTRLPLPGAIGTITLTRECNLIRSPMAVVAFLLATLSIACNGPSSDSAVSEQAAVRGITSELQESAPIDGRCALPAEPDTVRVDGGAVLLVWEFPDDPVYSQSVLPADSAYLAYRSAIRADGAALRDPVADRPTPQTDEEIELWRNEDVNAELARSGEAGSIELINCLDALLFAHQNSRVSQLTHPTEFLASVLRRNVDGQSQLAIVFGAGEEMYPPKTVYGFDVVDEYVARGWRYSSALHNHTIRRNGDLLALGTPALSTSDVQLTRNLASESGLESARVTNGFYTYSVPATELGLLRSR